MPRYRFSEFTLSTRTRVLIRNGQQLPLIPRYLDLLIFLIERRHDAVHRREIFDRVWTDVIVSDSALSQAIRTLRRTLGDDPRDPRFIRTVSRHGYQFTCPDVVELPDDQLADAGPEPVAAADAEVHTEQTRQKLGASLATVPSAAARASAGAALAGALAGVAGGLLMAIAPDNTAPPAVVPVLGLAGAVAGGVGGFGVGAGIAVAESSSRLRHMAGVTVGAALGGAAAGTAAQWLMLWTLSAVVGLRPPIGGGIEGLLIGGATGFGYASARRLGLTPNFRPRTAAVVAAVCAAAALGLSWAGRPLVGGTLHLVAREARGSQISLAPLGRLLGEPGFGPLSQALIAAWEGGAFGLGVALALVRRRSHGDLTDRSAAAQDSPAP